MAAEERPDETGKSGPRSTGAQAFRDEELDRRRQELGAALAAKVPDERERGNARESGPATGYAQAFKLSSEFIAGIAVGAGLGWAIDRLAGSTPWGLVVFLLLGFCAGILNVLRSVGKVAEFGKGSGRSRED
ncbi:MAG: AtpZ/AtpI family protein [Rhizobiales bacterium]|nr:AtpZ/AtpI family protein [Hyphomicrobiales bacterium]